MPWIARFAVAAGLAVAAGAATASPRDYAAVNPAVIDQIDASSPSGPLPDQLRVASIDETAARGNVESSQSGAFETSVIGQSEASDFASVAQYGEDEFSSIVQSGAGNWAAVSQRGAGARSTISQSGSANIAVVRQ